MARPKFVPLPSQSPRRFEPLLGAGYRRVEEMAGRARERFDGRAVWHFNSTLRGGGVAEMLRGLLPYVRGAGIDTRWVVLRERPEFFELTKRIHNNLHGNPGDGGELGAAEHELYERCLAASARHFSNLVQPRDVVFLHDPQTAGLAAAAKAAGAIVVWRCHIGTDAPNDFVDEAWSFLRPYIDCADVLIFSRRQHVWTGIDHDRVRIVPPAIDHRSAKNQPLAPESIDAILHAAGLHSKPGGGSATYVRREGDTEIASDFGYVGDDVGR